MNNLNYIVDPLIGTLIGFGTNYLAVKMLFRPYKPIKIGKITLPFTPGVIPKRKDKMASAFGRAISNQIFTNKDIQNIFLSEDIKKVVVDSALKEILNENITIRELAVKNIDEEKYENIKIKLEEIIVSKIISGLLSIDLGNIIANEGVVAIREKLKGNFFGNFISDDKISKMALSAGDKIELYIKEHGEEVILPYIDTEVSDMEDKTLTEIIEKYEISDEKMRNVIEKIYIKIVNEKMSNIFESFNISEVIEKKISEMDIKDVEKLFMSVMKKELNAIVNLGAVLGFLLGCINIFL